MVFFMHLLISVNLKNAYTLLYIIKREGRKHYLFHLPCFSLPSPLLPPCYDLATLISDKTMAVGKKMRTFALY